MISKCEGCGVESIYELCPACADRIHGAAVRIVRLEALLLDQQMACANLRTLLPDEKGEGAVLCTCTECKILGGDDEEWCKVCTRMKNAADYVIALEDAIHDADVERSRLTMEAARRVSKHRTKHEKH